MLTPPPYIVTPIVLQLLRRRDKKNESIFYLLIKDVFDEEWLENISDELRMDVGIPDLGVQQLAHRSLRLGADLLWLVADVQLRHINWVDKKFIE